MAINMSTQNVEIARYAGAMYGLVLDNSTVVSVENEANVNGMNMNAVVNQVYGADFSSATNATVASTVVTNLGLTGTLQTQAQAYILAQLNAASPGTQGATILSILNMFGQMTSDPVWGAAATAWENKVSNAVTYGGNTANTANTSIGGMSPTPGGGTYVLTTGVDNLSGGPNATFLADNSSTSGGNYVTSVADTITGTGANNTFKAYLNSGTTAALNLPTITGVQNMYVNGGAMTALNVSGVTGLTSLVIDSATGAATYTLAGQALTLENMNTAVTNTVASTTDTAENITLSKVGNTTASTVNVSGTKVASIALTSSGTLASGTSNTITLTDTGAAASTITLGGTAAASITVGSGGSAGFAATGITSIDASAGSGGNTITISSGAAAADNNLAATFSFKAGSGGDTLDLTNADVAGAALTAAELNKMTITGGAGTDQVNLSNAIATGTTAITSFTSIETIGDTTASGTIEMNYFSGVSGVDLLGTTAGSVTINHLASAGTLVFDSGLVMSSNALTVNATGTGTADTLAWTVNSGATDATGTIAINGYETINLATSGTTAESLGSGAITLGASAGGNETLNITDSLGSGVALTFNGAITLSGASTAINVSGNGNQVFGGAITAGSLTDTGTGTITASAANAVLNANFSATTGSVTFDDAGAGSAALLKAGSGATTFTTSAYGDVITLGTGVTSVTETTGNTSALTITEAAGHTAANTFTMSIAHSNTAADSLTNFVFAQDTLKNTAHALAAGNELSATAGVVASGAFTSGAGFIAAAEASISPSAVGDTVIWYNATSNNTYVAEYTTAIVTTANQAHIVELVGVHATAISTTAGANTVHIA